MIIQLVFDQSDGNDASAAAPLKNNREYKDSQNNESTQIHNQTSENGNRKESDKMPDRTE